MKIYIVQWDTQTDSEAFIRHRKEYYKTKEDAMKRVDELTKMIDELGVINVNKPWCKEQELK